MATELWVFEINGEDKAGREGEDDVAYGVLELKTFVNGKTHGLIIYRSCLFSEEFPYYLSLREKKRGAKEKKNVFKCVKN